MTPAPTRRDLLRLGAAGLVAAGLRPLRAEPEKTKPIPIGIQLYSVGGECAKDLPATLKTLGEMGYDGVEFAGYHGWDRKPADLRKLLDDCGLRCCGTHTAINTLLGDRLQRTAELHQTLGNTFLIAPSLPGQYHGSREKWLATAKLFNDIAAKAKPLGMRVGYHNHGHEFKKFGDETGWDLFFAHTVPEVVMQLDTGNCMGGGGDPVAILKKFPGRATTVHLKESGGGGVVGEGSVKWKEILPLCSTSGGTQWYIVEFGGSPHGPIECARRCLANLRKMTA